ncbi:F1F0 ATP synthase subunit K [Martiniozyma asiatica (nom. inval.)]|nr:F1F0 ATP synthase subunit K [Martiniozyma asiatica]
MGAAYVILGKSVPPHFLALGTIGSVVALVMPKPWSSAPKKEAKIEAASSDEEKFIKNYLEKNSA